MIVMPGEIEFWPGPSSSATSGRACGVDTFEYRRRRVVSAISPAGSDMELAAGLKAYRAERAVSATAEQQAWVVIDDDYVLHPEANAYLSSLRSRDVR